MFVSLAAERLFDELSFAGVLITGELLLLPVVRLFAVLVVVVAGRAVGMLARVDVAEVFALRGFVLVAISGGVGFVTGKDSLLLLAAFSTGGLAGKRRPARREPAKRPRLGVAPGAGGGAISVERGFEVISRGCGLLLAMVVAAPVVDGVGVGLGCAVVVPLFEAVVLLLMLKPGRVGVGEATATGGFVTGVRLTGGFVTGGLEAADELLLPVVVLAVVARPGFSRRALSNSPW